MATAVSLQRVCKSYHGLPVLDDVSFEVNPGEFAAIVGPSGCGKTTVLRLLAGLDRPDTGWVAVGGENVVGPGPDRLLVFQEHALYPWRTVLDNVAFGLQLANTPKGRRLQEARQALARFGLAGFEAYYPQQLSGGMRQRASLARAFLIRPGVLLLDEPYGALDALTRLAMQNELLLQWRDSGMTVLLITHDVEEALYLADRVLVMSPRPGRILQVVNVDLKHPRDRATVPFATLRQAVLECLNVAS